MRPYYYRDHWLTYGITAGLVVVIIIAHLTGILRPIERAGIMLVSPIARTVTAGTASIGNVFSNLFSDKQSRIDELESTVTELTTDLAALREVEEENVTLRRQLGVQAAGDAQRVMARVLTVHPEERASLQLLIDVGTADGVMVGAPVITDGALVGFVTRADRSVSDVMVITDPNSTVPVYLSSKRQPGLLKGDIGFSRLTVTEIDRSTPPVVGDMVLVSDQSGRARTGIPVGTVASILTSDRDTYETAIVEPLAPFGDLSIVFVLTDPL